MFLAGLMVWDFRGMGGNLGGIAMLSASHAVSG